MTVAFFEVNTPFLPETTNRYSSLLLRQAASRLPLKVRTILVTLCLSTIGSTLVNVTSGGLTASARRAGDPLVRGADRGHPRATPLATPAEETVATVGADDDQVTRPVRFWVELSE